jgi:hypothetical protein
MLLQVKLDPVVDGLPADARQLRDLADGVALGHPQHGLHALEEPFICNALERFLKPKDIVTIEAQFSWAFRGSHAFSVDLQNAFFKKLLLTHLVFGNQARGFHLPKGLGHLRMVCPWCQLSTWTIRSSARR